MSRLNGRHALNVMNISQRSGWYLFVCFFFFPFIVGYCKLFKSSKNVRINLRVFNINARVLKACHRAFFAPCESQRFSNDFRGVCRCPADEKFLLYRWTFIKFIGVEWNAWWTERWNVRRRNQRGRKDIHRSLYAVNACVVIVDHAKGNIVDKFGRFDGMKFADVSSGTSVANFFYYLQWNILQSPRSLSLFTRQVVRDDS